HHLGDGLLESRRRARRANGAAVLVERNDRVRSHRHLPRTTLAADGRTGSPGWPAAVRTDDRFSLWTSAAGVAARGGTMVRGPATGSSPATGGRHPTLEHSRTGTPV